MAVTKNEAEDIKNKQLSICAEEIEKYLDPLLLSGQRSFSTTRLVALTANKIGSYNMMSFVQKVYKDKGWTINRDTGGDNRDYYDNIVFS